MLIIAIVLIIAGALLLALVHPADADGRRLRNLGAGALIVVGVILLVVVLTEVFDTKADVDTGLLAPTVLLSRLGAWLGNLNDRTSSHDERAGAPLRWVVLDRIAGTLYVLDRRWPDD